MSHANAVFSLVVRESQFTDDYNTKWVATCHVNGHDKPFVAYGGYAGTACSKAMEAAKDGYSVKLQELAQLEELKVLSSGSLDAD